ncbi:MAG: hypothetical protein KDB22_27300 [Planctomycetales bacterium]|nr:hypothetical protein [Planctomycetales bacterium]
MAMPVREALQVLIDTRDHSTIVVTNQGSSRVWPLLASHSLDFHYNPSTMGGAIPLALGLAISSPNSHVMVITGDGSLAMSLGSLITVVASGSTNLTVVVLNNGLYEVTGGQTVATNVVGVDYVGLAKATGFPAAFEFDRIESWRDEAQSVLKVSGPRLISLCVARTVAADLATEALDIEMQLKNLRAALRSG